jgi:hypothetical protein
LDKTIYRVFHQHKDEINKTISAHKEKIDITLKDHGERIMRTELELFDYAIEGPARARKL